MADDDPGYTETPSLPHAPYGVHDPDRPHPETVEPGRPAFPGPPGDATILYDGGPLTGWECTDGAHPDWVVTSEYAKVAPGSGDIRTKTPIGDCQLHLEWAAPAVISGASQGRGNSGVFLMDRYEIQVLDNYDNPTYADGYAGAVYGQEPPLVNPLRPPGEWQSYDILWRAPRFDDNELLEPARVTAFCNGVLIQDDFELNGPTTHKDVAGYDPHPQAAPLRLQDHGDEVRFRNIWVRER